MRPFLHVSTETTHTHSYSAFVKALSVFCLNFSDVFCLHCAESIQSRLHFHLTEGVTFYTGLTCWHTRALYRNGKGAVQRRWASFNKLLGRWAYNLAISSKSWNPLTSWFCTSQTGCWIAVSILQSLVLWNCCLVLAIMLLPQWSNEGGDGGLRTIRPVFLWDLAALNDICSVKEFCRPFGLACKTSLQC